MPLLDRNEFPGARAAPMLRWDRRQNDSSDLAGDHGKVWGRHVLQPRCHQDLSADDVSATAASIRDLLVFGAQT